MRCGIPGFSLVVGAAALITAAATLGATAPTASLTFGADHEHVELTLTAGEQPICEFIFAESTAASRVPSQISAVDALSASSHGSLTSTTKLPGGLFGWKLDSPLQPGQSLVISITFTASVPPATAGDASTTSHAVAYPDCSSGAGSQEVEVTGPSGTERETPYLDSAHDSIEAALGLEGQATHAYKSGHLLAFKNHLAKARQDLHSAYDDLALARQGYELSAKDELPIALNVLRARTDDSLAADPPKHIRKSKSKAKLRAWTLRRMVEAKGDKTKALQLIARAKAQP